MKIDVSFTTSEFDILLNAIQALKGDLEKIYGRQEDIDAEFENVNALELRLRDILKGAVAKALK